MPTIAFGDWAPKIEKRIADLEDKVATLMNLNSELETTVTELRSAFNEQIAELFSQMEAARETLDEISDVMNEPDATQDETYSDSVNGDETFETLKLTPSESED